MTLHIFNPEHDMALAFGKANFTSPHAGSKLRHDLGWLPALWAHGDDAVLVDNLPTAQRRWQRLTARIASLGGVTGMPSAERLFIPSDKERHVLAAVSKVSPWGWDAALRAQLLRKGVNENVLPSKEQLSTIRALSHRRTAAALLPLLRLDGTVGEAFECSTPDEVRELLGRYDRLVLKAPWSSSGRGLRFVSNSGVPHFLPLTSQLAAWLDNVLRVQGTVMAEPYYNKVKDFGMEFMAHEDGRMSYEGLSLFSTRNGAYTGNLLATEKAKRELMARYVPLDLLDEVAHRICRHMEQTMGFEGPFGVDMMVVDDSQGGAAPRFALHPCVEINLRRTMGHVALALSPLVNPRCDDEVVRVMRITYEDNLYKLKIER